MKTESKECFNVANETMILENKKKSKKLNELKWRKEKENTND